MKLKRIKRTLIVKLTVVSMNEDFADFIERKASAI
jgi:hypothetical protein